MSKQNQQNTNQHLKFKEAAREIETDDDEKRFDEKLRRITKAPEKKSEKQD